MKMLILILVSLINITSLMASNFGIGLNPVENPPDAICRLEHEGTTICTGTVVHSLKENKPIFVSAGHCFKENRKNFKISCGCTDEIKCRETFKLKKIKPNFKSDYSNKVMVDYAYAQLDHLPRQITPLPIATSESLNKLLSLDIDDYECLVNGFGGQNSYLANKTPKVFNTKQKIKINSYYNNNNILSATYFSFKSPLFTGRLNYFQSDQDIRDEIKKAVSNRVTDFFNVNGDSGSGLLCRLDPSENYQLFGVLSGSIISQDLNVVKNQDEPLPGYSGTTRIQKGIITYQSDITIQDNIIVFTTDRLK